MRSTHAGTASGCTGRHAARKRHRVREVAAGAGWLAFIAAVTAAYLTRLAVVTVWRRAGHNGRLLAGMTGSVPLALLAATMKILPGGDFAALLGGGVLMACFGIWLRVGHARGQQEWRERRGRKTLAGEGEIAAENRAMIDEDRRLLYELMDRMDAYEAGQAAAYALAGKTHPALYPPLRAVGDGTGPMRRLRLRAAVLGIPVGVRAFHRHAQLVGGDLHRVWQAVEGL